MLVHLVAGLCGVLWMLVHVLSHGEVGAGVASPWYEEPEARVALAARDVGAVYRLLQRVGVSQREIARRTGRPSPRCRR